MDTPLGSTGYLSAPKYYGFDAELPKGESVERAEPNEKSGFNFGKVLVKILFVIGALILIPPILLFLVCMFSFRS